MAWHGWGKWIPQNTKDKRIGSSSKAQDSIFYILVIQDHIESIGKANTIKEGWGVAWWVSCFKCLVICSKNPQLLSHIHLWSKPKVKLGPTDSFYPAPPSSDVIATATNPSQIGLTDRDLGLTETGLQSLCMCPLSKSVQPSLWNRSYRDYNVNSMFPFRNILVSPKWANRSHWVYLTNSLVSLLPKSVSPSLCNWSHRDYIMP